MSARRALLWLWCLPLLAAGLPARAQADEHPSSTGAASAPVRATVVHIDGDEVVIDAGREQLAGSQALTVYRAIEVRHPITRKLLRDRFVIGALQVVQPGQALSVTKLAGSPAHPLAVGDIVEIGTPPSAASTSSAVAVGGEAAPPRVAVPPSAAAPTATAGAPAAPSASVPASAPAANTPERELLSYWYASLSQAPERRARLYQAYLERHPESPYKGFVSNEIKYLRELDARLAGKPVAGPTAPRVASGGRVDMLAVTGAEENRALELAALVRPEPGFRALLLHVRGLEETGYRTLTMQVDARGHARATIPASWVKPPGLAYFVEAVNAEGRATLAVGEATQPKLVVVRGPVPKPKLAERATRVRFSSEVASFDGTSGRDYFLVNEGDFLYRVRKGPLYGVRMGYGNFRGEGGTVQELDVAKLDPRPAGFSYGFFETELALHRLFGVAGRVTVGLGRPDVQGSERAGITGGFQLRARIGEADGTRLVLAGELMPEIGQRAFIGLAWEAIERVPMQTEIVVTDQPVNSDELAVRLIYEIGYRFSDRVSVSLRPSYQLRTIRHAGPGIGMAATFDW